MGTMRNTKHFIIVISESHREFQKHFPTSYQPVTCEGRTHSVILVKIMLDGPGDCFNIKISYHYWNSHHKDETVSQLFYLYNGKPYTWKEGLYIETGPWCQASPDRIQGWTWRKKFMYHEEVITWKHFPRYWPFVSGIHRTPVDSPHKGQWRGSLTFSVICASTNNRGAGNLRRNRAHYDATVMRRALSPCQDNPASNKATIRIPTFPPPLNRMLSFDNFRCSQWREFLQNDNPSIPMSASKECLIVITLCVCCVMWAIWQRGPIHSTWWLLITQHICNHHDDAGQSTVTLRMVQRIGTSLCLLYD